GSEAFETAIKFCYTVKFELNSYNVAALRDEEWDNLVNIISEQSVASLSAQGKEFFRDMKVRVEMPRCIAWGNLDIMEDNVENPSPQSAPQVLPSFEVYTLPVTYQEEVEETLGTPLEEISSFDEPESQPNPLPNCPSINISIGDKRGPKPPIKPHSNDSSRMKVILDKESPGTLRMIRI
ncbi:hypothetical protein Tco_0736931, partial [Tanacetum coccineum]